MGLEAIIAKIEADAEERAGELERNAASREEEILGEARREAEKRRQSILERGHRRAGLVEEQVRDMAKLEVRKQRLELKQRLLDEVFRGVVEELREMGKGEYRDLLRSLVLGSDLDGEFEVVTSAAEAAHLDDAFLGSIAKPKLSLADECRELGGGFILRRGRREFNFTFAALTRSLRRNMEKRLLEVLGLDEE